MDYNGYINCSLESAERTRKLLDCNRPFDRNLYTLLFQRFTPFPGRPYFEEGRDYYFISKYGLFLNVMKDRILSKSAMSNIALNLKTCFIPVRMIFKNSLEILKFVNIGMPFCQKDLLNIC